MKRISVKLVGSKIEPFTICVSPGDTAGDILSRLNLGSYALAIPPAPNRYFDPTDEVYEELLEGDYLLAVSPPAPSAAPLEEIADTAAPAYKWVKIRVYGNKRPPVHIQIRSGTTVAHVLAFLKLPGYVPVLTGTTCTRRRRTATHSLPSMVLQRHALRLRS